MIKINITTKKDDFNNLRVIGSNKAFLRENSKDDFKIAKSINKHKTLNKIINDKNNASNYNSLFKCKNFSSSIPSINYIKKVDNDKTDDKLYNKEKIIRSDIFNDNQNMMRTMSSMVFKNESNPLEKKEFNLSKPNKIISLFSSKERKEHENKLKEIIEKNNNRTTKNENTNISKKIEYLLI